jgi:hypothetical protein
MGKRAIDSAADYVLREVGRIPLQLREVGHEGQGGLRFVQAEAGATPIVRSAEKLYLQMVGVEKNGR